MNYEELVEKLRVVLVERDGRSISDRTRLLQSQERRDTEGTCAGHTSAHVTCISREKSGLAEHLARDAFLTALDDPESELKVREREPPDLETAARIAKQFEVSRGLVEPSGGQRRVTRQVTEEQRTSNDDIKNLTARVRAMEQRLQRNATASKHPGDEPPHSQHQANNQPAVSDTHHAVGATVQLTMKRHRTENNSYVRKYAN